MNVVLVVVLFLQTWRAAIIPMPATAIGLAADDLVVGRVAPARGRPASTGHPRPVTTVEAAARIGIDNATISIVVPFPGTRLFARLEREGRILTRDWSKYNGATVVFQPKRMSPQQLANCQVAAFRQFYSWPSMHERLGLIPFAKWAWLINIAINQGFRFYYRRTRNPMPDFRQARLWPGLQTAQAVSCP